jgi:hypothetical protein
MQGEWRNKYRTSVGKLAVKRPLGDLGVDRRIILKCILSVRACTGFFHLAEDMSQWWALLNTSVSYRIP